MKVKRKLKDPNTLRVFFSSPFGGMEEEREELTRKYFPQFHHACNSKGIQFVAVDMRWGITSEAAANAQVIKICLRELDRSDVFVGFFGQRYGWHGATDAQLQENFDNAVGLYPWLNDVRDRSVTELEFLHGHLNDPGALPACICFRDKAYDDALYENAKIKGDDKTVFKYMAESELSSERMRDLITRVTKSDEKALGINICYKNPHEGAKFIFETIFPTCLELLKGEEAPVMSPLDYTRVCHNAKLASLTSVFIGGDNYLDTLSLENLTVKPRYLISGPQGSGKSAVMANLMKRLKTDHPNLNIIYHFVGSGPGTTDPLEIIKHITDELEFLNTGVKKSSPDIDSFMMNEIENIHAIYLKMLQEMEKLVSQGKGLVLLIDSLNSVKEGEKTAQRLFWLPKDFPQGVRVIVSTVDTDIKAYNMLTSEQDYSVLQLQPLSTETQKQICEESLKKSGKEFSPPQLERVMDADQTKNPLFLKIFLGEISLHGNFFTLDHEIDSLINSEGIRDLLNKVLIRLEHDYNVEDYSGDLVQQVMSAIAVSHRGLSEAEIQKMFNIPSHVWAPFYFALENFLISHGGLLRYSSNEIIEAVRERYLSTEEARNQAIESVVCHFNVKLKTSKTVNYLTDSLMQRIANEMVWLQKTLDDKKGLFEALGDIRIFYPLMLRSKSETIELWKASGVTADDLCASLINSFNVAIGNVYLAQTDNGETDCEPPGYILIPVLNNVKTFFVEICHYQSSIEVMNRQISILENMKGLGVPEDVRTAMLRNCKYNLGIAYVDDTQYELGYSLLTSLKQECESYLETTDDKRAKQTLAYCCNGIGNKFMRQGHFKQAMPLFVQSAEVHEELGNGESVTDSIVNQGAVKMNTGELEPAMEYFQKAMESYERFYFGCLPLVVGNLLTNMAIVQRRMGNLDEAEKLYFRSLEVKGQAVGWDHEVVATAYMNLGTLEMYRNNYHKAEEYTRKAVQIHENNNVKLEQNEVWQSLENLAVVLLELQKHDEAVPIFLRVFAMLKKEKKIYQGFSTLHLKMIKLMSGRGMLQEVIEVVEAYVSSPDLRLLRNPSLFSFLDCHNRKLPPEQRKQIPEECTVEYALKELWPGHHELTAYFVHTEVLPKKDIDRLLELLDCMDRMNPDLMSSAYMEGTMWCEEINDWQGLARVATAGLEKYPNSFDLKTRLFDAYRQLKQFKDAYPLMTDILEEGKDNQALILVCGQVALMSNDLKLCRELWEKASSMPDSNLAEMAKSSLQRISELMGPSADNDNDNDNDNES